MKKNSMQITQSRDLFLYKTLGRTEKPKSEDRSGGSSTHSSSSGKPMVVAVESSESVTIGITTPICYDES